MGRFEEEVFSRQEPPQFVKFRTSRVVKHCPLATVFVIPQFGQLKMAWKIWNLLLVILQRISLHVLIGPRRFDLCRQFCWHHHGLRIVLSNVSFPALFEPTRDYPGQFVPHVRCCSEKTELIDGNDCAKNRFGCVVVTTRMCRQFSFSFASKSSSFQKTGSSEFGMSTFTEVDHRVLSDTIPFSIRLVRVCSAPFLF